jgi:Terminase RNaseH-like domain
MDRLINAALQGRPVAWFAPNYRLPSDVFRQVQATLTPVISRTSQQEWRLELKGGGVVEMWSLDSPDAGRGRAYAVAVVDECAMVRDLQEAWQRTIRPMLTDYRGEAWFLRTPSGVNHFKTLFDYGQDPERPEWISWQMPTAENPHIDPEEIESARLDLPEAVFHQEYLALFVTWEGCVFRRIADAAAAPANAQPEEDHRYVIGCDWGRSIDCTVFMVVDIDKRTVVEMERFKRVDYTIQCDRLKVLSERWRPEQIIAEQNGMGQAIIDQLTRDGVNIQPFVTTHASKTQAIDSLALAFERGEIRIPNDPVLVGELVAYRAEALPSGSLRYSAPSGQHDDTVMALAMAWTAITNESRIIYSVPDSTLIVNDFKVPDHWKHAYGIDIRFPWTAVIWGAIDPESDILYLYDEYLGDDDSASVAGVIRSLGAWIPGLIDQEASGRARLDSLGLVRIYRQLRLDLQLINSPLESGVLKMSDRMRSGRLKVFASLSNYLGERRVYRRNERDEIVRQHDNLQDAARCLINGIASFRSKLVKRQVVREPVYHGERSWMGWGG